MGLLFVIFYCFFCVKKDKQLVKKSFYRRNFSLFHTSGFENCFSSVIYLKITIYNVLKKHYI
ncbi:hypothetical protein D3C72_750760 [compost metagenome]